MGDVIDINKDKGRKVLLCDCGNASFIVGMDGMLYCSSCDQEYINDVAQWVLDHKDKPVVDGREKGVMVVHNLSHHTLAARRITDSIVKEIDDTVFIFMAKKDGNVRWWIEGSIDPQQADWCRRRLEIMIKAEQRDDTGD